MTKPGFSFVFILCCSIFCNGCMFAFVVFVSVFQYKAKRLAGKNFFRNDLFYVGWDVTQSVNHCWGFSALMLLVVRLEWCRKPVPCHLYTRFFQNKVVEVNHCVWCDHEVWICHHQVIMLSCHSVLTLFVSCMVSDISALSVFNMI